MTPYNYDDNVQNPFLAQKDFYNTIKEECPFPSGFK